jgi:hypothetical protein
MNGKSPPQDEAVMPFFAPDQAGKIRGDQAIRFIAEGRAGIKGGRLAKSLRPQ